MGMKTLRHRWPAAVAGILIVLSSSLAAAAPGPYALSGLGNPPGDSKWPAQPYAINGDGHDLDPQLDYAYAFAYGVNDAGQVVGSGAVPVSGDTQAVMWQDGVRHQLGTLGGTHSHALAINAIGQIVGQSTSAGNTSWSAFIYDQGRMWDLTPLMKLGGSGWGLVTANAINDRGQIVGLGLHNGRYQPFLLTPVPASDMAP